MPRFIRALSRALMTLPALVALVLAANVLSPVSSASADARNSGVEKPVVEEPAKTSEEVDDSYDVRLTTFNILSSSMAPGGLVRAQRAAKWVQAQGADAAAFQEVAADQLWRLKEVLPRYGFFPRRTLGTRGSAIQIAWNTKTVKKVEQGYIMRPFLGRLRPIPYVRLRDRDTGRGFWVVAIHNSPGGHKTERIISTNAQIALVKRLLGRGQRPVFVIGDVNERSEFCTRFAQATPLHSMNGGSARTPCPVPRLGGPDWMIGTGAKFSGFAKVHNGISDHPALTARASVPAKG